MREGTLGESWRTTKNCPDEEAAQNGKNPHRDTAHDVERHEAAEDRAEVVVLGSGELHFRNEDSQEWKKDKKWVALWIPPFWNKGLKKEVDRNVPFSP